MEGEEEEERRQKNSRERKRRGMWGEGRGGDSETAGYFSEGSEQSGPTLWRGHNGLP